MADLADRAVRRARLARGVAAGLRAGVRGAVPPSVQVVGAPWSEERLLALAGLLERR